MINKNQLGLTIGCLFAVIHAVWALIIAIMPATMQTFLDWIFELHFLKPVWIITSFNILNALFLIIVTFIFGWIFGWIFAALWNWAGKKSKK